MFPRKALIQLITNQICLILNRKRKKDAEICGIVFRSHMIRHIRSANSGKGEEKKMDLQAIQNYLDFRLRWDPRLLRAPFFYLEANRTYLE